MTRTDPPSVIPPGVFLAFEGGDGSGKTTQIAELSSRLRALGHEVVVTREPGGSALGRQLRDILLHGSDVSPRVEALLFAADRADHVATVIRPALERGAVVLTDRYIDSSVAYQGSGRRLGVTFVRELSLWATGGLLPSLTVLLDVPIDVGRRRRGQHPDRMEAADEAFHERVRDGFATLAASAPDHYLVIDSTQPPEAVADVIGRRVEQLLWTRARPDPTAGAGAAVEPDAERLGATGRSVP